MRIGGSLSDTLAGGIGTTRLYYRDRTQQVDRSRFRDESVVLNRREQALSLRLRYRRQRLRLSGSVDAGRIRDRNTGQTLPLRTYRLQTGLQWDRQSYHASVSYRAGHTLFGRIQRRDWTGSLSARATLGDRLRLRAQFYGTHTVAPRERTYGLASASLRYTLPFGHVLTVEGRRQAFGERFGEDQAFEFSAGYTVPLSLPVGRRENRLRGRVYDTQNGKGIPDVLLHLRGTTARTDEDGTFRLVLPEEAGIYDLHLDRNSLGLQRTLLREMPVSVRFTGTERPLPVEIGVARSVTVSGKARRFRTPGLPGAQRDTVDAGGVGGAVLEMTRAEEARGRQQRRRAVTDAQGRFAFTDLAPGRWVLHIVQPALPPDYAFEQKRLSFELRPGRTHKLRLRAFAEERNLRILDEGELKLEEPEQPEAPSDDVRTPASCEGPDARYLVVDKGDWLSTLARMLYGSIDLWPKLWLANQYQIDDPDLIFLGQRLCVPPKVPLSERERQALAAYRRTHSTR
jgi:nucleoid-associated protein YgaU